MKEPMKYLQRISLLFFVLQVFVGCTYTGEVREGFYEPSDSYTEKIPLTVGLVQDKQTKGLRFSMAGGGHGVDLALYPAIIRATESELVTLFEKVNVIDDPLRKGEEDLLVFVRTKTREVSRNELL